MKNLSVFDAPLLQVRVRLNVLCDKRGRGDAEHVDGKFFLIHQFRSGNAHEFDADTHEADVVDIGGDIRTRPGEADPAAEGLRRGIDAVSKLRRKIVVNDKLPANDALSLGVSSSLKPAWFPESAHLRVKAFDDGVEIFLFARQKLFLGDFQAFVLAPFIHQCSDEARYWIAKGCVEYRSQPGIDSTFHLQKEHRRVAHPV